MSIVTRWNLDRAKKIIKEKIFKIESNPSLGTYTVRVRSGALITAVVSGDLNQTETLLKCGANPNEFNAEHDTFPILWATETGKIEFIDLFLKYGANPNMISNKGDFALFQAAKNKDEKVAEALLNPPFVKNHILTLCCIRELSDIDCVLNKDYLCLDIFKEIIKDTFKTGTNPNQTFAPYNCDLPLKIAAVNGNYAVVELLLKHGADPNITTKDDWAQNEETPLESAIRWTGKAKADRKLDYEKTIRLLEFATIKSHYSRNSQK